MRLRRRTMERKGGEEIILRKNTFKLTTSLTCSSNAFFKLGMKCLRILAPITGSSRPPSMNSSMASQSALQMLCSMVISLDCEREL